jgi:MFS family permease
MPDSPEIPPSTLETPAEPQPSVPFDLFLAPGRGWFRALRHADFRVFWTGNFVSNIGSWMQNVAQGWLMLELTNSPFWLGMLGFAQQVPILIFSLPAGVVADRAGRRPVLLATQTVMMTLALALALLTSFEWITVHYMVIIAFLAGTTMAFNAPTYQAAIRDLVGGKEDTLNAIALNSIQFNSSRVLGPSLAGFAIAAAGAGLCFYLNALSYVPLLFVLTRVNFPLRANREASSMRAEMAEGFRHVWKHREILVLVVLVAMVSTFGLPYLVMMPAFARDVLHVGPKGLGWLTASAGVGALLGGIHLAMQQAHRRRGPLVLGAAIVFFAAILLFCVSRRPALSAALLGFAGGAMVSCVATVNSLIQTQVPDHLRGRVLSMHTMAFLGFTPLGSLVVGTLAEWWDAPTALAFSSGFALLLTAVIATTASGVRKLH